MLELLVCFMVLYLGDQQFFAWRSDYYAPDPLIRFALVILISPCAVMLFERGLKRVK